MLRSKHVGLEYSASPDAEYSSSVVPLWEDA